MSFTLKNVIPWGRSLKEYKLIFNLTETDLQKTILGCSDGPASFNAEIKSLGNNITSIDPVYRFSKEDLNNRINDTYNKVMDQLFKNKGDYLWNLFSSPEDLGKTRLNSMNIFLDDYEAGKKEGRYITGALPLLPFKDNTFELSLTSHFLFLYSDHFSFDFHLDSIWELLRVSSEVRIFPITDLSCKPSVHFSKIITELDKKKIDHSTKKVDYEFQRGGNQMLVLKK